MNSSMTAFVITVALIAGIIALGVLEKKRELTRNRKALLEGFGAIPHKKRSPERLKTLRGYLETHIGEGLPLDEITISDLEIPELFERIDNTQSAAGEEYLWFLLCSPLANAGGAYLTDEEIGRAYDSAREKERLDVQLSLKKLGRTGNYSVYEYLDRLPSLGKRSNAKHWICILLIAAAFGSMFLSVPFGMTALIAVLVFNTATYFSEKRAIEPYLVCFRYLLRLIRAGEEISGIYLRSGKGEADAAGKEGIVLQNAEKMRDLSGSLAPLRKGAGLVMSETGSSNPADLVLDYLRILLHLDIIRFNSMLAFVREKDEDIDGLITLIGRADTAVSIASFRKSLPLWCTPSLRDDFDPTSGEAVFTVKDLYHPLLSDPVTNSVSIRRQLLLTGSNASGKSTFLKAAALCALLSQTILTAPASCYSACRFGIMTSMALRDSLKDGESYYMAEIRSLKRILDEEAADGTVYPILCCIDEVLRGTNTIERIAASSEILHTFAGKRIVCFAATHDIELTGLLPEYEQYHFREELQGKDVVFSYRLHEGAAKSRNAIRLLTAAGFAESITQNAEDRARRFEETGIWT